MPFYDYVCLACATRIEVMHGVNDAGPALCSACGGTLRRALSAPTIVFKGSGWAKKDARSSARPTGETGEKPDGAGDGKPKSDGAKDTGKSKAEGGPSEAKTPPADSKQDTAAS